MSGVYNADLLISRYHSASIPQAVITNRPIMKNTPVVLCCLVLASSYVPIAITAFIEVPNELIGSEVSFFEEDSLREKRQVKIDGKISSQAKSISLEAHKNIYSDPRTSIDGTLLASSQKEKGFPSQHSASVGLNAQRNLYDSGKTKLDLSSSFQRDVAKGSRPFDSGYVRLDGSRQILKNDNSNLNVNAYAMRNLGTGSRPRDTFGAGLEYTQTIARGKHGVLEGYANVQNHWNTPDRFSTGFGIRFFPKY